MFIKKKKKLFLPFFVFFSEVESSFSHKENPPPNVMREFHYFLQRKPYSPTIATTCSAVASNPSTDWGIDFPSGADWNTNEQTKHSDLWDPVNYLGCIYYGKILSTIWSIITDVINAKEGVCLVSNPASWKDCISAFLFGHFWSVP